MKLNALFENMDNPHFIGKPRIFVIRGFEFYDPWTALLNGAAECTIDLRANVFR